MGQTYAVAAISIRLALRDQSNYDRPLVDGQYERVAKARCSCARWQLRD